MCKEVVGPELAQRLPLEDPRSTRHGHCLPAGSFPSAQVCIFIISCLTFMLRREVVGPELAPRLPLEAKANPKYDNFVDDACQLGAKTTVAAGCMLGRGTTLGDKCSVKRSVLGHLCKIGSGVRCAHAWGHSLKGYATDHQNAAPCEIGSRVRRPFE